MNSRENKQATLPSVLQKLVLDYVELSPISDELQKIADNDYSFFYGTLLLSAAPTAVVLEASDKAVNEMKHIKDPNIRTLAQKATKCLGTAVAVATIPVDLAIGLAGVAANLGHYSLSAYKKHLLFSKRAEQAAENAINKLSYYVDEENLHKKLGI